GSVSASSIEDREVEIRITRFEHAPNRLLNELTLIERRSDNGNSRIGSKHGVSECRNIGVLEWWSIGAVDVGVVEYWCALGDIPVDGVSESDRLGLVRKFVYGSLPREKRWKGLKRKTGGKGK